MSIKVNLEKPELIPVVNSGCEKEFWVAIKINTANSQLNSEQSKIVTFLAQYQNRPYTEGDEDKDGDEALVNTDGEYVNSVGWVTCQTHYEFDNYYEIIAFKDNYKLLGWADYTPPVFIVK
jgi:hypothetical protein